VQTRGSVPVFWEQQAGTIDLKKLNLKDLGKNMGKTKKITVLRTFDATKAVFARHFHRQIEAYGLQVVINLLSTKKDGERDLISTLVDLNSPC
jgi:hypothetical protein